MDVESAKNEFSCATSELVLANVLSVSRWIAALLVFAAIIVSWVFSNSYSTVVLGILNLFAFIVLIGADMPGLRSVRFIRRSAYGICTGNFLRMSFFLVFMCLATARGYNELTSVNGTNYCISASVIMGFVSLMTFFSWLFFYRRRGDPEVHWLDPEAIKETAPVTQPTPVVAAAPISQNPTYPTTASGAGFSEVPLGGGQGAVYGTTQPVIVPPGQAVASPPLGTSGSAFSPYYEPTQPAVPPVSYQTQPAGTLAPRTPQQRMDTQV